MFPPEVSERLQTYVYRLIDPTNGETFYVGKGVGNRVFAHSRAENSLDGDELSDKLQRIRDIRNKGFEVLHIIHRHGMSEKTAIEVESALIDAYPGLTNVAGGAGSDDVGVAHATEILQRYAAKPAVFTHKAILINVNHSAEDRSSLYEASRFAWKLSRSKAQQAEVVLATIKGMIRGAYITERWMDATAENFAGRETVPGRLGFIGATAPSDIWSLYVGKRVPDEYRKRGAANPIKYTWTT